MMLASTTLLALAMLAMLPGSPFSKPLHHWLVEKPVDWAHRQNPRRLALLAIGFAAVAVLAMAAPEMLPLMGMFGDTAILEVFAAIWLAAMVGSVAGAWRRAVGLASRLARLARRVATFRRRARPRDRRKPGEPAPHRPDDSKAEPGGARAFA